MLPITVEEEVAYLRRRAKSLGYKLVKDTKVKGLVNGMPYCRFPNFGKGWKESDVQYLVEALNTDVPLETMVKEVGRSPGSILGKLGSVKELWYDSKQRGYSYLKGPKRGQVYCQYAELKTLEKKYEW